MKNVRLKLGDLFRSRKSNYGQFDYSDNIGTGGIFIAF